MTGEDVGRPAGESHSGQSLGSALVNTIAQKILTYFRRERSAAIHHNGKRQPMNSKSEISGVQAEPLLRSMEEEISNSVRVNRLTNRLGGSKPQPDDVEDVNQSIGELIEKVSATSIAELEKLISDMKGVRNHLKAEGDRIQQEMARYAHLSETASFSVKIISESLGQWRKEPTMITTDNGRPPVARAAR